MTIGSQGQEEQRLRLDYHKIGTNRHNFIKYYMTEYTTAIQMGSFIKTNGNYKVRIFHIKNLTLKEQSLDFKLNFLTL